MRAVSWILEIATGELIRRSGLGRIFELSLNMVATAHPPQPMWVLPAPPQQKRGQPIAWFIIGIDDNIRKVVQIPNATEAAG